MASTTALYTGLSGLQVHARKLDVVGNNIANANTTSFKSGRAMFETQFSRLLRPGTPPAGARGGANPSQVGLGVRFAGVQRDFTPGGVQLTGDSRDLAIDGPGFFVVDRNGQQYYTRDGSFRQDLRDDLVTINGDRLMGYGVDAQFNIDRTQLVPINVPVDKLTIAEATTQTVIAGNLNAAGDLPGGGSLISLGTATGGLSLVSTATAPATAPNVLEATSLVSEILDPTAGDTVTPMFAVGDSIELSGATKGGKVIDDASLTITATTTVQELMDFLNTTLGIQQTGGANPDGATPGVSLDPLTGVVSVVGNTGTVNDLDIDSADLRRVDASGTLVSLPLTSVESQDADGESVRTTMVVFDSLGTPLEVDVTFTVDAKTNTGTTWRYYIESPDDQAGGRALTTGTVSFDTFGRLSTQTPISVALDRDNTGAVDPLVFDISLIGNPGETTALTDSPSEIATVFRDGLAAGRLDDFAVDGAGVVQGSFTNGAVRTLGQVVLATFSNQEGLLEQGDNIWSQSAASGDAILRDPGTLGTAPILGGSLELSNVDLGREFIDLVVTQTGYSAATRVIRTTDELMQQLLVLGR